MERQNPSEINKQTEWILQQFIDPKNPKMEYRQFASDLLDKFIADNPQQGQKQMKETLMGLFGDVENARQFNETYIGHMLSEACIPGMWGYMLATRLGSNTVAREVSEMETRLEPEAIRGLLDIVGYDKEKASGTFTSGGSMAVFTSMDVAIKKIKRQYETDKKAIKKPLVFLYNPFAHYSFHKAIDALGGPGRMIEKIAVEAENFKMVPADLEKKIKQLKKNGRVIAGVFAIGGETETGLVDPLRQIHDVARKYNIFTIADAAFGAPYRISRKGNLFEAINDYDAIIIDGHKTLYTPYSNGAVLFKDRKDHVLLNLGVKAPYVKFEEKESKLLENLGYQSKKFSLGEKRFEGSGGAGSILSTVAVLRTLGQEGLRIVYDITLDRIEHLYDRINQSSVLTPIHVPDINLLCFRIRPEIEKEFGILDNEKRDLVVEKSRIDDVDNGLTGKGGYFFSSTDFELKDFNGKIGKTSVWRACIMNPRTTDQIIDQAVEALEASVIKRLSSLH